MLIVDEFHHAEAPTYRRLLEHLRPRVLLGMTATPERMDPRKDVTRWFDGEIAFELQLWDALAQGLLCPFQYFGIADDVSLEQVAWRRVGYDAQALSDLYTGNDARAAKVLEAVSRYVLDPRGMRALGFCVSVEHAGYMARKFAEAGIPALALTGETPASERQEGLRRLRSREVTSSFRSMSLTRAWTFPRSTRCSCSGRRRAQRCFSSRSGEGCASRRASPGRRCDGTVLSLSELLEHGYHSERGRAAQRITNRLRGLYPIWNKDFLYVLSAFIYEPIGWNARFGWRPIRLLTPQEIGVE